MKVKYLLLIIILNIFLNNCLIINVPKNEKNKSYVLIKLKIPQEKQNRNYGDLTIIFYSNDKSYNYKFSIDNKYIFLELPPGLYNKFEITNNYVYEHNINKEFEKKGSYFYTDNIELLAQKDNITIFPFYFDFDNYILDIGRTAFMSVSLNYINIGSQELIEILENLKKSNNYKSYNTFSIFNSFYNIDINTQKLIIEINNNKQNILTNNDLLNGSLKYDFDRVKKSLENHSDINYKDSKTKKTALFYAIRNDNIFELLLKYNPNVDLTDDKGYSVMDYAKQINFLNIIKKLEDYKKKNK